MSFHIYFFKRQVKRQHQNRIIFNKRYLFILIAGMHGHVEVLFRRQFWNPVFHAARKSRRQSQSERAIGDIVGHFSGGRCCFDGVLFHHRARRLLCLLALLFRFFRSLVNRIFKPNCCLNASLFFADFLWAQIWKDPCKTFAFFWPKFERTLCLFIKYTF